MFWNIRNKRTVWLGTIAGTMFCVAAALLVDSFNFPNLNPAALRRAITVDILLPTALAGPLLFLLLRQMRQLAIARDEMAVMASTDSLTAVLNRSAFAMLTETYLAQTEANRPRPGTLLIVDADHFKSINDDFGHQVGDEALLQIASVIQAGLRPTDFVGRIGGEEFGIFLPGASRAQAVAIAERIREAVRQSAFPHTDEHRLSISIGGVSFRKKSDYDELFKVADQCLYEAKNRGRNQVCVVDYIGKAAAA
jgi:diguanylate cyclase